MKVGYISNLAIGNIDVSNLTHAKKEILDETLKPYNWSRSETNLHKSDRGNSMFSSIYHTDSSSVSLMGQIRISTASFPLICCQHHKFPPSSWWCLWPTEGKEVLIYRSLDDLLVRSSTGRSCSLSATQALDFLKQHGFRLNKWKSFLQHTKYDTWEYCWTGTWENVPIIRMTGQIPLCYRKDPAQVHSGPHVPSLPASLHHCLHWFHTWGPVLRQWLFFLYQFQIILLATQKMRMQMQLS